MKILIMLALSCISLNVIAADNSDTPPKKQPYATPCMKKGCEYLVMGKPPVEAGKPPVDCNNKEFQNDMGKICQSKQLSYGSCDVDPENLYLIIQCCQDNKEIQHQANQ